MESLYQLIHSLAKEEKRLYSVHGRKARFSTIYETYLGSPEFSRDLDREIFEKHFSSFSKAYYSMQKTDLLEDLLGILLEYSNSKNESFSAIRSRAKFDVLRFRGFPKLAAEYLQPRLEGLENHLSNLEYLRLLEDLRDTLAQCPGVSWNQYETVLRRITIYQDQVKEAEPLADSLRKLSVMISSVTPDNFDQNKQLALAELERLKMLANELPAGGSIIFDGEYRFRKTFESQFELHQFLVRSEKKFTEQSVGMDLRMQVVNLLLESCMETGDFLLINGLSYKTYKEIPNLSAELKSKYLPLFYELNALYHFYENDLPRAQQELLALIALGGHSEETMHRLHQHKVAMLIAANIPRTAQESIDQLFKLFPEEKNSLRSRYSELIISIEFNQSPLVVSSLQKLKAQLRKMGRVKEAVPGRKFLDLVEKIIERKKGREFDFSGLETNWRDLLKVNLWLKGKLENNFYYNLILDDWQNRRKVLPAERVTSSVA